ncbi:MAG TPA: hypothetical protein VNG12_19685 [Acidimicrobiales bacterium]|nr:hypothetical protein [Acidimicrobiales bacterium]
MVIDRFSQGIGGVVAGAAVVIAVVSLIFAVFIIVIVANRAEPDPRGMRPQSVYLFGMSFVTLQFTFAGSVLVVSALCSLVAPHNSPLTNVIAREVVIGLLLMVIAGGTMAVHFRRGLETAKGDGPSGPNWRVMQSYGGVVSFIYLLEVLVALGFGIYLVVELIGPGVFGSIDASRSGTVAALLELAYVLVASGVILVLHSSVGPSAMRRKTAAQPPAATP